jgi:hypothetical protein
MGVELQELHSHTAADIKHQAQEITRLEAKNVELQTQVRHYSLLIFPLYFECWLTLSPATLEIPHRL